MPHFSEQIIKEFGIDPTEIPNWEELSTGQLYALLSRHPSLHELYEADEHTERNRRMDVLDDLRAIWDYEEDGGAPTPDELERSGKVAWESLAEILREIDEDKRIFLALSALLDGYILKIPTGAERWTPDNIRRVTRLLEEALEYEWVGFSESWDAIRFELDAELTALVKRMNMQEVLARGWISRPQNTMAETRVGTLRRRICSELPPPGFFANETEAQAFDTLQQAFRVLLDDAYAEEVLDAIGVWDPSGAWYSRSNVKKLETYIDRILKHLYRNSPTPPNAPPVMKGLWPGAADRTLSRTFSLFRARQRYAETLGITPATDTHETKTNLT